MRVDDEQRLTVVMLAVDKSHKQATRLGTEDILQDASVHVVAKFLARGFFAVAKEAGITRGASGLTRGLDFLVCTVGETQYKLIETLAIFLLSGQE